MLSLWSSEHNREDMQTDTPTSQLAGVKGLSWSLSTCFLCFVGALSTSWSSFESRRRAWLWTESTGRKRLLSETMAAEVSPCSHSCSWVNTMLWRRCEKESEILSWLQFNVGPQCGVWGENWYYLKIFVYCLDQRQFRHNDPLLRSDHTWTRCWGLSSFRKTWANNSRLGMGIF